MKLEDRKRILILDNEPVILDRVERALRSSNFEARGTSRWTEALDMVTHNPPDLVLMDLRMPTVQGETLLGHIREQDHCLPIVVMSETCGPETREDLQKLKIQDFVLKPLQLDKLVGTVQGVLDRIPPRTASPLPEGVPDSPSDIPEQDIGDSHSVSQPPSRPKNRRNRFRLRLWKSRAFRLYFIISLVGLISVLNG